MDTDTKPQHIFHPHVRGIPTGFKSFSPGLPAQRATLGPRQTIFNPERVGFRGANCYNPFRVDFKHRATQGRLADSPTLG